MKLEILDPIKVHKNKWLVEATGHFALCEPTSPFHFSRTFSHNVKGDRLALTYAAMFRKLLTDYEGLAKGFFEGHEDGHPTYGHVCDWLETNGFSSGDIDVPADESNCYVPKIERYRVLFFDVNGIPHDVKIIE